jgi:hypothetical protein
MERIVGTGFTFDPLPGAERRPAPAAAAVAAKPAQPPAARSAVVDTVIAEAAGEGAKGMQAVAGVIKNRAERRGLDPDAVVKQPKQFTGYEHPGSGAKAAQRDPRIRAEAEQIVDGVMTGALPDITGGADHYHADSIRPGWAGGLKKTTKIGSHEFYDSGGGGKPAGKQARTSDGRLTPNWGNAARLGNSSTAQWKKDNLTVIEPVKGQRWEVYKPAAAAFDGLIKDLAAQGYNVKSSGGYNYRPIRGSKKLSQHAFGTAIDINAADNPLGGGKTNLPANIRELAAKHGLVWGGDFKGRKDPMHFEYAGTVGDPGVDYGTTGAVTKGSGGITRIVVNQNTKLAPTNAPPLPGIPEFDPVASFQQAPMVDPVAAPGAAPVVGPNAAVADPYAQLNASRAAQGLPPVTVMPARQYERWKKKFDANQPGILSDVGNLLDIGWQGIATSIDSLINIVPGGEYVTAGTRKIDEWLTGKPTPELVAANIKEDEGQLSAATQAARKKNWYDDKTDTMGDAWTDPRAYMSTIVESIPATVLTMGPTGMIWKGAYAAAVARGMTVEAASALAAKTALKAGGISEGLLSAGSTADQVKQELAALPQSVWDASESYQAMIKQGVSPEEAKASIIDSQSAKAGIMAGVATGLVGGRGDMVLANIFTKGIKGGLARRMVKGAAKEGAAETLEETIQSGGEQVATNVGVQGVDPNRKLSEGVANAVLGGAVAGGAMGVGMGGPAGAFSRDETDAPPPAADDGSGAPPAGGLPPPAGGSPAGGPGGGPPTPEGAGLSAGANLPGRVKGPLERSLDHGESEAQRQVAQQAVSQGAPPPGAKVTVQIPGVEGPDGIVAGVVHSYDASGNPNIQFLDDGQIATVPLAQVMPEIGQGGDITLGPGEYSQNPPADVTATAGQGEAAPVPTDAGAAEQLTPQQQEMVDLLNYGKINRDDFDAMSDEDASKLLQSLAQQRAAEQAAQAGGAPLAEQPAGAKPGAATAAPAAPAITPEKAARKAALVRDVPSRSGQLKSTKFPDVFHGTIYDLGEARAAVAPKQRAEVNRDAQQQIADKLKISYDSAGAIVDDYFVRSREAADLGKIMHRVRPIVLMRMQAEHAKAQAKAKEAPQQAKAPAEAPAAAPATKPAAGAAVAPLSAKEVRERADKQGISFEQLRKQVGATELFYGQWTDEEKAMAAVILSGKPQAEGAPVISGKVDPKFPFFQRADRIITMMDIGGVMVPFYISTGQGGKKDVKAGKWYPFFGYGKDDGWFNKGNQAQINDYYGNPLLREAAEQLDKQWGDIQKRRNEAPPASDLSKFGDKMAKAFPGQLVIDTGPLFAHLPNADNDGHAAQKIGEFISKLPRAKTAPSPATASPPLAAGEAAAANPKAPVTPAAAAAAPTPDNTEDEEYSKLTPEQQKLDDISWGAYRIAEANDAIRRYESGEMEGPSGYGKGKKARDRGIEDARHEIAFQEKKIKAALATLPQERHAEILAKAHAQAAATRALDAKIIADRKAKATPDTEAEKRRKIDEGFAQNRAALGNFKKGDTVEFTHKDFYREPVDGSRDRVFVGTVVKVSDKEQGVFEVKGETGDQWFVQARHLRPHAAPASAKEKTPAGQSTSEEAKPEPKAKKPTKAERHWAEFLARVTAYYAPGNIVKSYGGTHDRVLAFDVDADGRWVVTVKHAVKVNGEWVDDPKDDRIRKHGGTPSEKDLAAGPVATAAPFDAADTALAKAMKPKEAEAAPAKQGRTIPRDTTLDTSNKLYKDLGIDSLQLGEQPGDAARAEVERRGKESGGIESLIAIDQHGDVIANGIGTDKNVVFPDQLSKIIRDPNEQVVAHHNHPNDRGFSLADIAIGRYKGMVALYAHATDGVSYRLSWRPAAKEKFGGHMRIDLTEVIEGSFRRVSTAIGDHRTAAGRLVADVNRENSHLRMMALRDAGWLDYHATGRPDSPLLLNSDIKAAYDTAVTSLKRKLPGRHADGPAGRAGAIRHPGDISQLHTVPEPAAAKPAAQRGAEASAAKPAAKSGRPSKVDPNQDTLLADEDRLPGTVPQPGPTRAQRGARIAWVDAMSRPLPVTPTGNRGRRATVADVARAFTARHADRVGPQLHPESDTADYRRIMTMAREEMAHQLPQSNSGVGWYSSDVQLAIELTSNVFPTLLTNQGHRDLYLTFAGIFSSGTDPDQAWMMAAGAFEAYLHTGEIPINRADAARALGRPVQMSTFKDNKTKQMVTRPAGWGIRNGTNVQQLGLLKYLVEREGGLDQAMDWLINENTARTDVNKAMIDSGLFKGGRYKNAAQRAGPPTYGFLVFGPKLGRYCLGLHGVPITHEDTTVDLWFTRTFRRWTGRLFEAPLGKEGIAAQPANDAERATIMNVVRDLGRELNMVPGDIQAVLWFFEKRLWGAHGLPTEEGTNSTGARRLLAGRGVDDGVTGSRTSDQRAAEASQTAAGRAQGRLRALVDEELDGLEADLEDLHPPTTPQFKRWFGKSAVVDGQGKPEAVFHHGGFDETTDIPKEGMHFGTRASAEDRAFLKVDEDAMRAVETYQNDDGEWHWDDGQGMTSEDMGEGPFADAEEALADGQNVVTQNSYEGDLEDLGNLTAAWLSIQNPMTSDDVGIGPDGPERWAKQIAKAKALGHDGIVYRNQREDRGSRSWIAFGPKQIKSVNNKGSFDPEKEHILEADTENLRPSGYQTDNPGGEWLKGKQRVAEKDIADGSHHGLYGSQTASAGMNEKGPPLYLPVSELAKLPGRNREQPAPGQVKYDDLKKSVDAKGYTDENPVYVMVNHRGQPFLNEGNNRVAVAAATGVKRVKAWVAWRNGGEDTKGPWDPASVARMEQSIADPDMLRSDDEEYFPPAYKATPQMKRWLKGTKVVDAKGEPLPVFRGEHGTPGPETFQSRLSSLSFGSVNAANVYAKIPNDHRDRTQTRWSRITPVFLRIKNPVIENRDDPYVDFSEIIAKLGRPLAERMAREHAGAIENTNNWEENFSFLGGGTVGGMLNIYPDKLGDLYMDAYALLDDPEFVAAAKAAGYDGAIHMGNGATFDDLEYRIFDAAQAKSTHNQAPTDDEDILGADTETLRETLEDIRGAVVNMVSTISKPKGWDLKKRIASLWSGATPAMLGAVYLNYLPDLAPPSIKRFITKYLEMKRAMDTMRNVIHNEADVNVQAWRKFARSGQAHVKALALLMHDATKVGVDPDDLNDMQEPDYAALKARFDALPQSGRDLYRAIRDDYKRRGEELDQLLLDNVAKAEEISRRTAERKRQKKEDAINADTRLSDAEKLAQIAALNASHAAADARSSYSLAYRLNRLRTIFESNKVKAPYFPLGRFGDHYVAIRDENGKLVYFAMAESKYEAEKEKRRAMQHMQPTDTIKTGLMQSKAGGGGRDEVIKPSFIADIETMLAGMPDADSPANRIVRDSIMDQIWQRHLQSQPEVSNRRHKIHRKRIEGHSDDAMRVYASHMFHAAHQMAKLKYGAELQDLVDQMSDTATEAPEAEQHFATQMATEMKARHNWVMNPVGKAWSQWASSLAFGYYLGTSPAAAVVNLAQTPMVGIPVLAGKFGGMGKAASQIARASRNAVSNRGMSATEERAMRDLVDVGAIDNTNSYDIQGVSEQGATYSPVRRRVMGWMTGMFHKAEVINRRVTGLAAYRMAIEAGEDHEHAVRTASDMIWKIHFDFANSSRPRHLTGPGMKVLFSMRSYQINMVYRLGYDLFKSMKGATPQEKREARYQLAGIIGMQALFAGATGVAGYNTAFFIYGLASTILSAIFGGADDGDDPFTAQEDFEAAIKEMFGPYLSAVLLHGPVGAGTGLDLTSRIGMPDIWFRSPNKDIDSGEALYGELLAQTAGAPFGIIQQVLKAYDNFSQGYTERGAEALSPKFFRDILKSYRYMTEGVTTKEGEPIIPYDDTGWWSVIATATGFTPAHIAEKWDEVSKLKGAEKRLKVNRQAYINGYALAVKLGDDAGRDAAIEKIRAWNASPYGRTMPIKSSSIASSLKHRAVAAGKRERGDGILIQNEALRRVLMAGPEPVN